MVLVSATVLIAAVVIIVTLWLGNRDRVDQELVARDYDPAYEILERKDIAHEAGPFTPLKNDNLPLVDFEISDEKRDLFAYYERRAYPGAPPLIPHPVEPDIANENKRCLACHLKGGYVAKWEAFTPVTPHPEKISCGQCHLGVQDEGVFKRATWKKINPPELARAALADSPHPIPHGLQMRENCIACHATPATPEKIRSDHPERINCLQCHVRIGVKEVWTRTASVQVGGK